MSRFMMKKFMSISNHKVSNLGTFEAKILGFEAAKKA